MSRKLFVGGVSWNTSEESLRSAFERFGEVEEAKIIYDRETGRSRGFGFVTFVREEDGATAITQMDGKELDGRPIRVNAAQERENQNKFGGGGGGRRERRY